MSLSIQYRLKHLFSKRIGGAWGTEPDENAVICLRAADILTDQFSHKGHDLTYRTFSDQELISRKLQRGDIIIEKSGGGENQPVGRVSKFILEEDALCSNFLDLLRPNNEIVTTNYISYLLYNLWKNRTVVKSIKQTTGIQNLDIEDYFDNKVKIPTITQQNKIVDYLDNEIAKIDALIEKKTQLIAILEEKKKAVINRAVTEGLDPNVSMKYSGIQWLGDIPEHWKVVKLKYFIDINYGLSQPPEYLDSGTPLIRATNVFRGKISEKDMVYIDAEQLDSNKKITLKKGDIIIVRSGAYTADSAIITEEYENSIAGFDMVIRAKKSLFNKYLSYVLLSDYMLNKQLIPMRVRAAQPHLNAEEVGSTALVLPTLEEQASIVKHLEMFLQHNEESINLVNCSIELLKEKRIAIIAAAVNGELNASLS